MSTFTAIIFFINLLLAITYSLSFITKLSMVVASQHSGHPTKVKVTPFDMTVVALFWSIIICMRLGS